MHHRAAEYDYEASSYDESRFCGGLGKHLDYMHKRIVGGFLHTNRKMVLDVGTGTGRFAAWLAKKGFEVIGVDVSEEMLKKAKRKAHPQSKNVHLVLGDVNFLPFRKGTFGSCICINVINHIHSANKFFNEVRYVIRPEGFFIFNFPNLQSPYLPIAIIVNLRKKALFKGGKIRSKWFTLREIDKLLSETGFNIEELQGCMIASPIPLGESLVKIVRIINFFCKTSKFKLFSSSLFIKAQPFTKLKLAVP